MLSSLGLVLKKPEHQENLVDRRTSQHTNVKREAAIILSSIDEMIKSESNQMRLSNEQTNLGQQITLKRKTKKAR